MSALTEKISEIEKTNLDAAKKVARKFDAYEASYSYLKKTAQGGAGISDQKKLSAQKALEELQPKYVIRELS